MGDYRQLEVWQLARELTASIYQLTASFPDAERFVLVPQLRRAVNSIGANIAEGIGRSSPRDTKRFLDIAIGSANEVEQHLTIACDVGAAKEEEVAELASALARIRRMLVGLRSTMATRDPRSRD